MCNYKDKITKFFFVKQPNKDLVWWKKHSWNPATKADAKIRIEEQKSKK